MELTFNVPTQVVLGDGCILKNAGLLAGMGRRALIVTSPSSARNGSLLDLKRVFEEQEITYEVWDKMMPNP